MKKMFVSLLCCLALSNITIVSAGVTASTANLTDEEKVTKLLDDIDQLNKVIEIKKSEIKQLNGENKSDNGVVFEDIEIDVSDWGAFDAFEIKLLQRGVNYEPETPIAFWVLHTKIVGNEKQFPSMGMQGSVSVENEEYIEWAESDTAILESFGDGYFEFGEEPPYGRKYAPGWESYYMVIVELDNPDAEYVLTNSLSEHSIKVPVYSID